MSNLYNHAHSQWCNSQGPAAVHAESLFIPREQCMMGIGKAVYGNFFNIQSCGQLTTFLQECFESARFDVPSAFHEA